MAGRERLIRPGLAALAALVLAVLLLHLATLGWVSHELAGPPRLKAMADPVFTRLLQQAAAPPPPPAAPAPAPPALPRPPRAIVAARPAASQPPPTSEAPEAQAAASAPAPAQVASASPPAAPASAAASSAVARAATPPASGPSAPLDSWPVDTRVNYRMVGNYRGEVNGRARVQWQRQQDRYQVRVDVDVAVLLSFALVSQGSVTPQGLVPQAFQEERPGGVRAVELGEDSIRLNDGRTVPRPAGVQDTASQFAELSHRFATGQDALEVGHSVQLWLARPGGVDLWVYDVTEKVVLQTPELGPVEAYHVAPRPLDKPRGDITAEMWFAPSLQYLPVKVRMRKGDEAWLELTVLQIEQGGEPTPVPPGVQPEAPGPAPGPKI